MKIAKALLHVVFFYDTNVAFALAVVRSLRAWPGVPKPGTGVGQGLPGSSQPGREDGQPLVPGPARRPHRLGLYWSLSHLHPSRNG